jgi:hypothetical protein
MPNGGRKYRKHNILARKDSITKKKLVRQDHTNKHILYIAGKSRNTKDRRKGHAITPTINNDILKGTIDNVCSAVDSLKKCVV